MKRMALVLLAIACRRPLDPGESRCQTVNVGGVLQTKCEEGDEPAQERGWWCTSRSSDGFGRCGRQPGRCEQLRAMITSRCSAAPGSCDSYSPCAYQSPVICADSGCFTTSAGCAEGERAAGRGTLGCQSYP